MKFITTPLAAAIFTLIFIVSGCSDPTDPRFIEPDFTTVPELADTTQADPLTAETGIIYYIIEEGTSQWVLQGRPDEAISLFYTMRVKRDEEDNIIQSTYANGRTNPETKSLARLASDVGPGIREGMIGMKEGEHRVIVVTPEFGATGNDTIIYEVELEKIH